MSFYYSHQHHDDGGWRVDHAWGDNGLFDYRFVYDLEHRETRITDSLGHVTILQTNERGLPVARIDPLGGVTRYQYDERGRTRARTDPAGRATLWEYDTCGNLLAHTLADGSVIRAEYDADLRPVCVSAPGDRQWHYEWDDAGNLIGRVTPDKASFRYEYDRFGQLIAYTSPRGAITHFNYDDDGNLAELIDALGHRTRYVHDARANIIEMVNGLGQLSRYEYDRHGNLTRTIEPGEREFLCNYDADGNLIRYRDPRGHVTQFDYSPLGHVTRRFAPDGSVREYRYDTEGQLTGVINERGEVYDLRRDALGRIVEEIDYWRQSRRYEYGAGSELRRSIDPLGRVIDYETDTLGRIVQKRVPDPSRPEGIRTETFSYDRGGNLVVAENPDSRVERSCDAAGRIVAERQGDDFIIENIYDVAGNRVERRTRLKAGGEEVTHTVRYEHDALDMVSSIRIDDTAAIQFERDEFGQICVEHLGGALRREVSYTSEGLLEKQALFSGVGRLFESEYAYDADGGMTHEQDSRFGRERFDYDPTGRVTAHLDPAGRLHRVLHDRAGDPLDGSSGQGVNARSGTREGVINGCRYAFDCAGNLIRKQSDEGDVSLAWDGDGLLIETQTLRSAQAGCPSAIPGVHTQYIYDAFHRRIGKVVRPLNESSMRESSDPLSVSRFFWDGDVLVSEFTRGKSGIAQGPQELRQAKNELREWIYYPETFRPLASAHRFLARQAEASPSPRQSPAQYHYYCCEPNGAPVRVVDALGALKWEARYTARGKAIAMHSRSIDQPLRLQGQYFDIETGLAYNRYRYFDPDVGAFISQDPIGLEGGSNLYRYAPNVLGWFDPLGLDAQKDPLNQMRVQIQQKDMNIVSRTVKSASPITARELEMTMMKMIEDLRPIRPDLIPSAHGAAAQISKKARGIAPSGVASIGNILREWVKGKKDERIRFDVENVRGENLKCVR